MVNACLCSVITTPIRVLVAASGVEPDTLGTLSGRKGGIERPFRVTVPRCNGAPPKTYSVLMIGCEPSGTIVRLSAPASASM